PDGRVIGLCLQANGDGPRSLIEPAAANGEVGAAQPDAIVAGCLARRFAQEVCEALDPINLEIDVQVPGERVDRVPGGGTLALLDLAPVLLEQRADLVEATLLPEQLAQAVAELDLVGPGVAERGSQDFLRDGELALCLGRLGPELRSLVGQRRTTRHA